MDASDQELIERCQRELPYRTDAFELLLERYEPQVFHACRRYLRNAEDAEEAAQDALLRVFHGLPNFRGDASFKSWLYRIVTNVCASRYARLKSRRERLPEEPSVALDEVVAGTTTDFLPIGGIVEDALDSLPAEDQHVLFLRHIAGLPFDDVAGALGVGLSAAKMRLYRAEQRLAAAYHEHRGEPPS